MSFDRTITEQDLDPASEQFIQTLDSDTPARDADLDVDGMEESVGSRIFSLFGG